MRNEASSGGLKSQTGRVRVLSDACCSGPRCPCICSDEDAKRAHYARRPPRPTPPPPTAALKDKQDVSAALSQAAGLCQLPVANVTYH